MSGRLGWALWRSGLRSFFIQAAWNFERLQNLGFAFAAAPVLRRLYPDPERRRRALARHLEIFNTNPYLAPLVLGSTFKIEEEALERGQDPAPLATAHKLGLVGPLAAMGDSLFWATLRPLSAMLGVGIAWTAPGLPWWASVAMMLAAFNLPQMLLRLRGLARGYALGSRVAEFVREIDVQGLVAGFRLCALVALGALVASLGRFQHLASDLPMPFADNFLFLGGGLIMVLGLRLKISPLVLIGLSIPACVLFSLFQQGNP